MGRAKREGNGISQHAAITHCHNKMLPGVNDAQVFVFACSDEEAAVVVPTDIIDEVSVQVIQGQECLPSAHIPEDDHVVAPWWRKAELRKGPKES